MRKSRKLNQRGGTNPSAPPNIHQAIVNELIQEVHSWVTIGFADDGDIPLTNAEFEDIINLPEVKSKLQAIVANLENEYIADPTVFPFPGDAYREPLSELGVYEILDHFRVPQE